MATRLVSRGLGQVLARRAAQAPAMRQTLRGGGTKADPKIYGEFTPPHVSPVHKNLATAFGTFTFFWIFYRSYYDLPGLLGHHAFHDHDDEDEH